MNWTKLRLHSKQSGSLAPRKQRFRSETAAKENPEDLRVLMALGRLCMESNELDKASIAFEAVRKLGTPETEVQIGKRCKKKTRGSTRIDGTWPPLHGIQ